MDISGIKFIIGGAGLTGSVIAERIANDLGGKVLIFEKRAHIGGNCDSEVDPITEIEYHIYGTHIFHTSNKTVWDYVSRFVSLNNYFHQVLTVYNNKVYQMPVNLETINSFYNVNLRPFEVDQFINEVNKGEFYNPENFADHAISLVGRPLYEALIKGYTRKQWGREPSTLPLSIIKRLPFRKNYIESYFFDKWQGIPIEEYHKLFERMLLSDKITIIKSTDINNLKIHFPPDATLIHTGPIDSFYNFCFGKLDWRSLRFEKDVINVEDFQGTSVMNYADENIPYTRIHEPRHIHPERSYRIDKTLIIREYPDNNNQEQFYPVNDMKNQELYRSYLQLANKTPGVFFTGRLGSFKYLDMNTAIEQALSLYERIKISITK